MILPSDEKNQRISAFAMRLKDVGVSDPPAAGLCYSEILQCHKYFA